MAKKQVCEDCKFFVGEMHRAIGPNTGYCDNDKGPHYRKKVKGIDKACDEFEE